MQRYASLRSTMVGNDPQRFDMTQQPVTKALTVHVPSALAEKVDEIAARLDRSRGWVIRQALSSWIAEEDERDRLTREALAEVDAGNTIHHEDVRAWAESLSAEHPAPLPR